MNGRMHFILTWRHIDDPNKVSPLHVVILDIATACTQTFRSRMSLHPHMKGCITRSMVQLEHHKITATSAHNRIMVAIMGISIPHHRQGLIHANGRCAGRWYGGRLRTSMSRRSLLRNCDSKFGNFRRTFETHDLCLRNTDQRVVISIEAIEAIVRCLHISIREVARARECVIWDTTICLESEHSRQVSF